MSFGIMRLSKASEKMVVWIIIIALVFIAGGAAYFRSIEALYFAIGVILTSSLNVGRIFLLDRTVKKTLEMDDPSTGKMFVRLQFLLRYLLTGLVLMAAGLISVYVEPPFINIWGAVAGIFTMQIAVIIVRHRKLDD